MKLLKTLPSTTDNSIFIFIGIIANTTVVYKVSGTMVMNKS